MIGYRWIINFVLPIGLIIYGFLYKYKAVKKVSKYFGYKTTRTQLSKETWEYANIRAGNLWINLGSLFLIFVSVLLLIFPSQSENISILTIITGIIIIVYTFSKVDKEIKEKFDDKGEPK